MTPKLKKLLHNLLVGLLLLTLVIAYRIYEESRPRIKNKEVMGTKAQLTMFEICLEYFEKDVGRFPTEAEGLQILFANPHNIPDWKGPYIVRNIPPDGWGNDYVYHCPGKDTPYEIISYGADGKPGGEGENEDIIFVPGKEWIEK